MARVASLRGRVGARQTCPVVVPQTTLRKRWSQNLTARRLRVNYAK